MIKLLIALCLFPALSFADEMPPEWKLPNKGKGCTFREAFHEGTKITCGVEAYQLWTCPDSDYLLVGSYETDTVPICSPTLVIHHAVPQAKPQR